MRCRDPKVIHPILVGQFTPPKAKTFWTTGAFHLMPPTDANGHRHRQSVGLSPEIYVGQILGLGHPLLAAAGSCQSLGLFSCDGKNKLMVSGFNPGHPSHMMRRTSIFKDPETRVDNLLWARQRNDFSRTHPTPGVQPPPPCG